MSLEKITKENHPECFCSVCGRSYLKKDYQFKLTKNLYQKELNGKLYYRKFCQDCLYQLYKKKQRNCIWNEATAITFGMPVDEVLIKAKEKYSSNNVETFIKKYGLTDGPQKYEEYKQFQSKKNTFAYKRQKYGMTKEAFKKYNQSRAITEENLIKKYGEEGKIKWNEYCKRQSYAGCRLEYFQEIYGKEEGQKYYDELNKKKSWSKQSLIKRFGEKVGIEKYESWYKKTILHLKDIPKISKSSQEFFNVLNQKIKDNNFIYAEKNNEYAVYIKALGKYAFLDFYDMKSNKAIEFYGDYWHANPNSYKGHAPYLHESNLKLCKEKWAEDEERIEFLKKEYNIEVKIIWERDWKQNPEMCIENCIYFLTHNLNEEQNAILDL